MSGRRSSPSPMRAPLALFLLGVTVLTPACAWFGRDKDRSEDSAAGDDDSAEAAPEDERTAVRVEVLGRGSIAQRIATSATVDSDQRADILVETSGTVESIAVEEGASVSAGQVLATLKNPQLRGELDRVTAAFERARAEFESLRSLMDKGFVARNDYDTAAHAHDTARLTKQQAEAAYAACQLSTPIRGTVSLRDLRYGEAVGPPKLAFQVVDLTQLKVDLNLPEKDLARIAVGQVARVRTEVRPDLDLVGEVLRISPVVDPRTGTVKVTVAIDPQQRELRPGMFVNVDIVVDTHADALLAPKRALTYAEGKPSIFVVQGEGDATTASRRAVTLGFSEDDLVEVLSGAESGERAIVVGQTTLRDGATIRIHEVPPGQNAELPPPL